jgi:hypothetical protein
VNLMKVSVVDARPAPHAASPAIVFRLRIDELSGAPIHALALRCQVRIDPQRRRYTGDEQARLYELFGDVPQWKRTLRSVTWANVVALAPAFSRSIELDLAVPCTYDLEVASAKYLHAVREGGVPLLFLFSGTLFAASGHALAVEPVSWDTEASYVMPAEVWRAAIDQFFPGGGWLRVGAETLDRLQAFRAQRAAVGWDEALDALLQQAGTGGPQQAAHTKEIA